MQKFFIIFIFCLITGCVSLSSNTEKISNKIFIRGLVGNIYSLGMNKMSDNVNGNNFAFTSGLTIYNKIIEADPNRVRDYYIAGHSLGANVAINLANKLSKNGYKVKYLVTLDPTITIVPNSKIQNVINYYTNDIRAKEIPNAKNIHLNTLSHIQMDDDPEIQKQISDWFR